MKPYECRACGGSEFKEFKREARKGRKSFMERICSVCKKGSMKNYCDKNRDKLNDISREFGKTPRRSEISRKSALKRHYNLSIEQHDAMGGAQGWRCAICEGLFMPKTPCVDHSHSTGEVRGLLCNPCNQMIGYAKEDISILQEAIEYLRNGGHQGAMAILKIKGYEVKI